MTPSLANPAATANVCLVVMLKHPARSKRRLAAEIGPRATRIAEYLCECALEDARGWPGPVCLAPASSADRDWLVQRGAAAGLVVEQRGANLGERISHVDSALRALGHTQLLYIGTDCPALDADHLARAAAALEKADVVLGPAHDGGLVLMGARRPWPELATLPWSTTALGQALVRACRQRGDRVCMLAPRSDLDHAGDLPEAQRHVAHDPRPARSAFADWFAGEPDLWRPPV